MTSIAPHMSAFLHERLPRERGASEHTRESYAYAFKLLFQFASARFKVPPSQLELEQLDAPLVLNFLTWLESTRGNCPSTRNARLVAIKSFMRYLEYRLPSVLEQSRQIHAIPLKKVDIPLVNHLTSVEIEALLNAPNLSTVVGTRDRAMMHLCFAAGLRVSELVSLPISSLSLQPDAHIKVMGKGRRERALPLWKQTVNDLRRWMAVRTVGPGVDELFVNARGQPMTRSGFEWVLAKHFRSAAVSCQSLAAKRLSPHVMRHSCALMILQATNDLRRVALWLGHADIRTTEQYLRVDPSKKLEALSAVVPPNLRRGRFKVPDKLMTMLMAR